MAETEVLRHNRNIHGGIVTQVLASEIGGFCTPEKERVLASIHLRRTGVLLRYSFETNEQWLERLAGHLEKNPAPAKPRLRMSKEQAVRSLTRLERQYAARPPIKTLKSEQERAAALADFEHMNDLRVVLGMERHDYAGKGVPEISRELQDAFEELESIAEPDARLAAVRTMKHPDLLRMVMLHDAHSAVRELAERRYGELLVAGKR